MINHTNKTKKIGIIGGGVMGSSLARYFLTKNCHVNLIEADNRLADQVLQKIKKTLQREVEKGKFDESKLAQWLSNFSVYTKVSALKDSEIIIEAVPEKLSLKKRLLAEVENSISSDAILASNTSSLPISALAAALAKPERLIGTHFFNPPHIMPLVEVIPGIDTHSQVILEILSFLNSIGKKPVQIKECPGFLVNRILGAYINEVMWLLEDIAGIFEVERTAQELGLPMGPLTMGDMVGWDIIYASNRNLASYYGNRFEMPPLLEKIYNEERFGAKTGLGLFDHSTKPPQPTDDFVRTTKNLDESQMKSVETRMKAALFAESLRCLDEGIAISADLDKAMVMGTGLPKGPISWADEIGLDLILEQLDSLNNEFGIRFWPPPILRIYVLAGYTGQNRRRGLAGTY